MKDWVKLLFSLGVCQAAGAVGSLFTLPSITTWYASLQRPAFAPPNWVFGPVWILLFLLMGASLYLVLKEDLKKKQVRLGLVLFGGQLALNVLWSLLFFGLRAPLYALAEIVVLWLAILATMAQFLKINRNAAYLLVPYLAWVSFAAVLNFFFWTLNG